MQFQRPILASSQPGMLIMQSGAGRNSTLTAGGYLAAWRLLWYMDGSVIRLQHCTASCH